jgi:hypothetical protein
VATSDLQRFHLGQAIHWSLAPAVRSLTARRKTPQDDPFSRLTAVWSAGHVLEAAGWLCLGADLGYYPRDETWQALRELLGGDSILTAVSAEDRPLVVTNDWAEPLAAGDLDQALDIRLFGDLHHGARVLLPAFQAGSLLARHYGGDTTSQWFLRMLLLAPDLYWTQHSEDRRLLEAASGGGPESWTAWEHPAENGHFLDCLLSTLRYLQALSTWASSTREPRVDRGEDHDSTTNPEPAERLVHAVGRLQRWRLDLSNDQVRSRLDATIDLADEELPRLLLAAGSSITDAWPNGFREAVTQALADWDEISGEATGDTTDPGRGSTGGSEMAQGTTKQGLDAEVASVVGEYPHPLGGGTA